MQVPSLKQNLNSGGLAVHGICKSIGLKRKKSYLFLMMSNLSKAKINSSDIYIFEENKNRRPHGALTLWRKSNRVFRI